MEERTVEYEYQGTALVGLAMVPAAEAPRPGVLVAHDWGGRNASAVDNARRLADQGYVGFALDMYGDGKVAEDMDERVALMGALRSDRATLIGRIAAALSAMKALPEVDAEHTAAIGFCFGGLCVLDLARSGSDVAGVVSLHGLLDPPPAELCKPKNTKVLVLHGYRDPMVPPEQVAAFEREMADANLDFQLHSYGNAMHAFTNPEANMPKMGAQHEPVTAARAFRSTDDFLRDVLA